MPSPQFITWFEWGLVITVAVVVLGALLRARYRRTATVPYDPELEHENDDPPSIETYRSYIENYIATGFMSRNEIINVVTEIAHDDNPSHAFHAEIEQLTDKLIQAHNLAQQSWPTVTDCDRLDAAFADLERSGIVCRQNFSCCGTCGVAEIGCEMEDQRITGRKIIGYTFYHAQDTESAVEGAGLCLNYGSIIDKPKLSIAVGKQVVEALDRHGLKTDWDGKFKNRIFVEVDWKRRTNSKTDQLPATEPT